MERMLINASQRDEKRVAIVSENVLFDFITERPGFEQKIGNIYLARITSIEPSLDAVFVEFGSERHGFLPLKEISREYFNTKADQQGRPGIRDLLRVGQELMIQVEKEERGNKGAALTTYISLAGSYLVLMPNSPRAGGISRRIEGDERDQLREILSQVTVPEGMGLIVRTAAIGRTNEELKWDLDVLLSHWNNIIEAARSRSAPFLIHQEGNVVIRAIRDYVRQDTAEIIIDDEAEYQNAKHYLEQTRPDVADRVKLYTEPTPLFSRYGIEHQIETAYKRTIDLPSGASIVIDYTEALVSIDINSARATKGRNIESTAFNTNLEAAQEIARQLRLRDIGGLIVIDFIDMLEASNQIEVEKHLSKALKDDRARIQIQRISRFGLLEMSRQRLRPSLRDSHQHVCPTCSGHGSIRSVDSVALTLARIIEEEALKPHTAEVVVQASTEAATYLLNEKRHLLAAIEKNHNVKVSVIPNPNLQSSNHLKKRIRVSDVDDSTLSSADRLQVAHVEINLPSVAERTGAGSDQPAVRQLMPSRPDKMLGGGLIKRLWTSMFGQQDGEDEVAANAPSPYRPTQPKPGDSTRSSSGRQQRPRRSSSDRQKENRDTREQSDDSRDRSPSNRRSTSQTKSSERSGQRSPSDNRQRSSNPRARSGNRNAPVSKLASTSKSGEEANQYEDNYREYTQNTQRSNMDDSGTRSTTPSNVATNKTGSTDQRLEEAPITIKASRSPNISEATPSTRKPSLPDNQVSAPSHSNVQDKMGPLSSNPRPSVNQHTETTEKTSLSNAASSTSQPSTTSSKTQRPSATTSYAPRSTSSAGTSTSRSFAPSGQATKPMATSASSPKASPAAQTNTIETSSAAISEPTTSFALPQSTTTSSEMPKTPTDNSSSSTTTSNSARPINIQSSESTEEDQKPLIVRATSEDKASQGTTASGLDKKDKESTE